MNTAILTVDDVASRNTPAIVDYLAEKGIRAVMFATGVNVERYYDEAKYALQKGMIVGNHSYSHPAFSQISMEEAVEEIEKCEAVLEKLYRDSGVARVWRPFRFPYGDKGGEKKEALQQYFREKGFHKLDDRQITYPWWQESRLDKDIDTLWTFDFEEYRLQWNDGFTKEHIWAKMREQNPKTGAALYGPDNAHIILTHAHDETDTIWPGYYRDMVEELIKNGVVFQRPIFL